MTTPSQLAKEFARQHGFTITSVGRRYSIYRDITPIADVGGYEAALNAMKRYVEPTQHADVVATAGATDVFADSIVGKTVEWVHSAGDPTPRESHHSVALTPQDHVELLDDPARPCALTPQEWADHRACTSVSLKTPGEIAADLLTGCESVFPAADAEAVRFAKQLTPPHAHPLIDEASRKQRRAARKSPSGPWHVIVEGLTAKQRGFPTRGEALKYTRQRLNDHEPEIGRYWRAATVVIEYRAS